MTRHHQIHVWLNDELHASLVRLARQNDETIATTLRRILHDYFHGLSQTEGSDEKVVSTRMKR
ncbi:MAG TPA: hypothetical protein VH702_10785 [Vicinamibacterales bacterium]|jgi:hypothetical protein